MKRQALVIGLGQFGLALARSLSASGVEVLAVDVLPERVQVAADAVSQAICCDAMDEEALARTAPASRDICVCAIGDEGREAAIIVTTLLRQLGAERVIARAGDELLERILRLVGAHEVVNPDKAFGERLARRLLYQGILEEVPLGEDLVMSEVRVPPALVGHRLAEEPALQLRLALATACLSYHERHTAALCARSDEEFRAAKQEPHPSPSPSPNPNLAN